jgi:hypothetical protein
MKNLFFLILLLLPIGLVAQILEPILKIPLQADASAISYDGKYLILSYSGRYIIYDIETGEATAPESDIMHLSGSKFAVGKDENIYYSGNYTVRDIVTHDSLNHYEEIFPVLRQAQYTCIDTSGTLIAYGCLCENSDKIVVYNVKEEKIHRIIETETKPFWLDISPDGKWVAAYFNLYKFFPTNENYFSSVMLYPTDGGEPITVSPWLDNRIGGFNPSFTKDSKKILYPSRNDSTDIFSLTVFDIETSNVDTVKLDRISITPINSNIFHWENDFAVAPTTTINPDGKSYDELTIVNYKTGDILYNKNNMIFNIQHLSKNGLIVSGNPDGGMVVYDLNDLEVGSIENRIKPEWINYSFRKGIIHVHNSKFIINSIDIININGIVIYSGNINATEYNYDMQNHPVGNYIIRLNIGEESFTFPISWGG